jgi:threonylcarbamoyladenosine tRNA methylthiotransferase MtaB
MGIQIAFHTLGCKLNFAETSSLQQKFAAEGYEIVDFATTADIYVLNTCSVTDFADRKCEKAVRRVKRQNTSSFVVVTGCYAQLKPQDVLALPGVDLVLGSAEKFALFDYVDKYFRERKSGLFHCSDIHLEHSFRSAFSFGSRTRAFLKVQDGCDYKCSFCTIPMARGHSRSDSISSICQKAITLVNRGVHEIVLTGVNIGDFRDRDQRFLDLLKALDHVRKLPRLRISSIEPNLCSDAIIEFAAGSEKILPHFHMPLQSGSDEILRLMRRRYKSALYRQRVEKIKTHMPQACVGVDVIVGFPGETDRHFAETVDFLDDLDVAYLHVFTYSERDHTPASELAKSIPLSVRKQRNAVLRELSAKKRQKFYEEHSGQVRKVLVEPKEGADFLTGYTDNYVRVKLPVRSNMAGSIQPVRLERCSTDGYLQASWCEQHAGVVR